MLRRRPCAVAVLVALLLCTAARLGTAKGIHVTVQASWNETSFLQEGCEWAGRSFGDAAFYSCVDALWDAALPSQNVAGDGDGAPSSSSIAKGTADARTASQRDQYAVMEGVARELAETHGANMALYQVEMAARVYAPAVEAHYATATQLWRDVAKSKPTTATAECACGDAFGVVYTRIGSLAGELQALPVCSTADLRAVQQRLVSAVVPSEAASLVLPTEVALPRLDHHYPSSAVPTRTSGARAVFVLYGLLGSARTRELHQAAVEWSAVGAPAAVAYYYRHLPVSRQRLCGSDHDGRAESETSGEVAGGAQWDAPLVVQGYGVTVDIKSMEYKVVDEKAASQQQQQQQQRQAEDEDSPAAPSVVAGFNVQRLKERYSHLASGLDAFAATVAAEAGTADEIKVNFEAWELQGLGLAATQYIRETENSSRRLQVLRDVVTRFPLYAATMARIATQPGRVQAVRQTLESVQLPLQPGVSALFVDGWRVEEKDMSLFGVLEALKADECVSRDVKRVLTTRVVMRDSNTEEAAVAAGEPYTTQSVAVDAAVLERVSAYVKRSARRAVDAIGATAADTVAYAIPSEQLLWLNDVTTDPRYSSMSAKLDTFFSKAPGVIPFPRRNLLNFVFIWNPVQPSHLQMLTLMLRLNQQGLLARHGLLLLDPDWSPEITQEVSGKEGTPGGFGGQSSLSHDVLAVSAVAYHLQRAGEPEAILELLVQLLQSGQASRSAETIESATVRQVCERYAAASLESPLDDLMSDADFLTYYHETQAVIRRFPMANYPATLLNGQVLDLAGGQLNLVLTQELMRLREWVTQGALTDSVEDIYSAILTLHGAADHLQPALLRPPQSMPWTTSASLVALVEGAPYLYSSSYQLDVPSLTQLVALPCRADVATLRQLQTVLSALQHCDGVVSEQDRHYTVCRSLRVSVVSCPTPSPVLQHVEGLLRSMADQDVAEGRRYLAVQRYVAHVLDAVAALPASAALNSGGVLAALEHSVLPSELQRHLPSPSFSSAVAPTTTVGCQQGVADFWAALESSAAVHHSNAVLVTNGRLVSMDGSFTAKDVLDAARLVLPMTQAVEEAVLKVNFAEMSAMAGSGGYTADEVGSAFYGGKIACLTSVFDREMNVHEAAKTMPLVREEALFATAEDRKRLRALLFSVNNTSTEAGAEAAAAVHTVTAVVDPSSRDAQVMVSLAAFLMESPLRVRLTVLLNPSLDVRFPVRDFYEFVASAAVQFDPVTGAVLPPAATFGQLPTAALLTLGVEEPQSWTVFSHAAEQDLDNILLSQLPPSTHVVTAVYRMHAITVTGDATDTRTGGPPDGLPLSLTPAHHDSRAGAAAAAATRSTDTQVMANLNGYYQLQSTPGLWFLSVKPGPVAAAYCIESVDTEVQQGCAVAQSAGEANHSAGQRIPVVVDSFSGRFLSLRVRPTASSSSSSSAGASEGLHAILQRMAADVTHTWPPSWLARGAKALPPSRPTLNVFSVASGHLYERFLRMMFYSVHATSSDKYGANTTRIKFWVIESFLSPQFKRYIPRLAEELGFEVGFVTYRWPWWLPRQTEKQRKIWAYKILFLDVLFPLDVDRIIFVDADQTAQSDLHELYNMDIGRSPVAMTPFCQKYRNEDTVRFRFWEHGFWVNHLKGKPYHISAIFLVDLRRFRAMRAGDRYRATYAGLAGDPNSLANLDQDLPNFMQATIPIFSLPEQWLWCETWCSATSKSKAKTIDLCNNPLTKMPKLDNAKMVIPGWEEVDNKLQNMTDAILAKLG